MKISKLVFAIASVSIFTLASCSDSKTKTKTITNEAHGHDHHADGSHMHDEIVEQEEFTVSTDSLPIKEESHSHGAGHDKHSH